MFKYTLRQHLEIA